MTRIVATIPTSLALSANGREHWAAKARKTRELRAIGRRLARGHKPMEHAHLVVHLGFPDRRRRDAANTHPTIKALVDGIVDAGLLPDDDNEHLTGPDLRPGPIGPKGQLVIDMHFQAVTP